MRYIHLIILALGLMLVGCSSGAPAATATVSPEVANVKVTQDGKVFLNGGEVTIDQLKTEFARLEAVKGVVCYFRDFPEGQTPEITRDVLQAVVDKQLTIQVSDKECGT